MQWTKSKVATWLLISLIPTGALAILSFVIFALFVDDPESSGSFLLALAFVLSAIYGPLALVAGLVLKIVAGSGGSPSLPGIETIHRNAWLATNL